VEVDGSARDACFGGDVVHRHLAVSETSDQALGGIEDDIAGRAGEAVDRVKRSPDAAASRRPARRVDRASESL
jgi:hypothetical protein